MCKGEEESGDRKLFHCSKARNLWQLVYSTVWSSSLGGTLLYVRKPLKLARVLCGE